ncbi:hypothetical protein LWI28_009795 [Acer negundo]|uniref:Aminotransferase-like plant mobile domain-containing protein n=1 Tax=Acer negundo TaxID=4023 RepID=A0AAD5J3V9_ACENE|nr:hypothetical protein LWI28_009795 [Acer negundo]
MENLSEAGSAVEREELMVSPSGDGEPTMRLAHFLRPTVTSIDEQIGENGLKKMASLHEPTWKKAGIHEAILNSTYEIRRNTDLVLGLAEKWCSETKGFIFSWSEATITLEDLMIHGYSVLGSPTFIASDTEESKKREEALNQARLELNRISTRKAEHCLWMKEFMNGGSDIKHGKFMALWLSRFVFPISYSIVTQSVFPIAIHLARETKIALAPDLSLLKEKIVALINFNRLTEG